MGRTMLRALAIVAVAAGVCAGAGCTSHVIRMRDARAAFVGGDLAAADRLIAARLEQWGSDADVLALDRAMVALADGRPEECERLLRQVRDRFEAHAEADAAESAWSLLTDDEERAYAGDDHEQVLLRVMLALANLVQDGDDAEAYSLQAVATQEAIMQRTRREDGSRPQAAWQQVAMAPYLRGALREATHRDYDDAGRHFTTVVAWQPDFRAGRAHVARATRGIHSPRGHGVVHVVALVGHGPIKVEVAEVPSTVAMMLAGEMLAAGAGTSLTPMVAPVKVPRVVAVPAAVGTVQVGIGAWVAGHTETVTDVSRLALARQQALLQETVARAVVRRTLKKGAMLGAKQGLGAAPGSLPSLAVDVAGIAWEATENADTRCWSLLPDTIQVARFELPAGEHELLLQPLDHSRGPRGGTVAQRVTVADGRDTFVVLRVLDTGLVGRPLTGPR
jgi:hypothetical protein